MEERGQQTGWRFLQALLCALPTPAGTPLLAEEVVLTDHAQNRVFRGRVAVDGLLRAFFHDGFPEARTERKTVLADGGTAMLEFVLHGRQQGPFLGIPATGRDVALPMVLVCRFVGDRVRQVALYYDAGTLLRQLGLAL